MTVDEMIMKLAKVPGNASVMLDSGWEYESSDCSRVLYCVECNAVILTQVDAPSAYDDKERFEEIF